RNDRPVGAALNTLANAAAADFVVAHERKVGRLHFAADRAVLRSTRRRALRDTVAGAAAVYGRDVDRSAEVKHLQPRATFARVAAGEARCPASIFAHDRLGALRIGVKELEVARDVCRQATRRA